MSGAAARASAPPSAPPGVSAERPWLPAAIAAGVVLACAVWSITPDPVGVFWDDGVYALTAKALAAGQGYRYPHLPGELPAIHYPPGYPAVLAAFLRVTPAFPDNVAILKLLNPVFLAAGVFGAVRLVARSCGVASAPAAVAVAVTALTAPVLALANVLLSESLFFALLVLALWRADRVVDAGGWRRALVAGAAIAALTLVRTIGGVLLPAALLVCWRRGRRREAAVVAATVLALIAPWQFWVWSVAPRFPAELIGSYGPYLAWGGDAYRADPSMLLAVLGRNLATLWRAFGVAFAPRLPHPVQWLAASGALAMAAIGVAELWSRARTLAVFVVLYGGVILCWPYNPERFVWAVWPLAGIVLLAAASALGAWGAPRWQHAPRVAAVVAVLLLAGQSAYAVRGLRGGWAGAAQREMTRRLWPLVAWASTHAAPDELVASDAHPMIALYTGLRTLPVSILTPAEYLHDKPLDRRAADLAELYKRYRPRLLVLSAFTPELDAVPRWAATPGAPAISALPAVPGGGSAFVLTERR